MVTIHRVYLVQSTWGPLYRSLQILVTYYQSILPASRTRRSSSISAGPPRQDYLSSERDGIAARPAAGSYIGLNRMLLTSAKKRRSRGLAFADGDED